MTYSLSFYTADTFPDTSEQREVNTHGRASALKHSLLKLQLENGLEKLAFDCRLPKVRKFCNTVFASGMFVESATQIFITNTYPIFEINNANCFSPACGGALWQVLST